MALVGLIPVKEQNDNFSGSLNLFMNKPIIGNIIDYCRKIGFLDKIVVLSNNAQVNEYISKNYKDIEIFNVPDCRFEIERVYRYYQKYNNNDWYFCFPSNDPTIDYNQINLVWNKIPKRTNEIITFYTSFFCDEDLNDSYSCKLISNYRDYMIYSSKSIIPTDKYNNPLSINQYKRHIGIFVFPKQILEKEGRTLWGNWKSNLSEFSGLQQNRLVDFKLIVKLYRIKHIGFDIENLDHVDILEKRILTRGKQSGYSNIVVQQLSEDCD